MLFGVCRGDNDIETLRYLKNIGFDYVECNFGGLARMSDDEYEEYKINLKSADIPCMASNCFLPNEYKVASGVYDEKSLAEYIENGMKRGSEIGMKTVAFGSGGARAIPDDVLYSEGFLNIGVFLKNIVKPIAEKYDITVVVEPLRLAECNIINTVKEGAMVASLGESENIGVLADIYHMVCGNDSFLNVKDLKGSLKHAHISYPFSDNEGMKRSYPKNKDEFDYKSFVDMLREVDCKTCSIEAGTDNLKDDAFKAINVLKTL